MSQRKVSKILSLDDEAFLSQADKSLKDMSPNELLCDKVGLLVEKRKVSAWRASCILSEMLGANEKEARRIYALYRRRV